MQNPLVGGQLRLPTYTRRRFFGRQPLCGIGVTSLISVTLIPAAWIARTADSRPDPGPLTYTEAWRTPCSIAFLAHSSAATWAANGVDLRDPLNPEPPALAHASAPPDGSVIVMIVLLNVDWTCTTPDWTLFLTFFLPVATELSLRLLLGQCLFLAGHGLDRALARARVGVGALAAHGQPAPMAQAPVAADVHQHLDVLRRLAAQVAFDGVVVLDHLAQAHELAVGEPVCPRVGRNLGLLADLAR